MLRNAASLRRFFSICRQPTLVAVVMSLAAPIAWSAVEPTVIGSLRQRADAGEAEAMMALGDAYARGDGVDENPIEAFRFYSRAAALGHTPAVFNVGLMSETGKGTRIDLARAFASYAKAADAGSATAQLKLGEMFANGRGTTRDDAAAATWYRRAADAGGAEAQYQLALAYEQGRGVPRDRNQAQKWYREAVERGYARAGYNLALMIESGFGSDAASAAEFYLMAAEQGFAPAQNNYGLLLAEGRGSVPIDLVESYAWLSIAVENGASTTGRDLVRNKLDSAQLAEAERRASEIRSKFLANATSTEAVSTTVVREVVEASPAPRPMGSETAASSQTRPTISGAETAALRAEILALSAEIKDLTRNNDRLRSDQERLSAENLRLAAALRTAQAAVVPPAPVGVSSEQWKTEREALEAQLRDSLVKLADAERRLVQLQETLKVMETAASRAEALTKLNADLEGRLQLLTEANQKLRQEQDQFAAQIQENASQRANAQTLENASDIERMRAELSESAAKLAAAEQQVAQLKQAEEEARSATAGIRQQMDKLRTDVSQSSADVIRLGELTNALGNATRENEDLRQQLAALRSRASQVDASEIARLRNALASAYARVTELESSSTQIASVTSAPPVMPIEEVKLSNVASLGDATTRNETRGVQPPSATTMPRRSPQRPTTATIASTASGANGRTISASPRPSVATTPQSLISPATRTIPTRAGRVRFHTVAKGESLTRISEHYYGTAGRWQEIYHANRDLLRSQTSIRVGQHLRVP